MGAKGGDEADEGEADGLFDLRPEEFVAARNRLAAELKKRGAGAAAARVKALERPTVEAWAIDQLARRHGGALRAFLASLERLKEAQLGVMGRAGDPGAFREAIDAERAAFQALRPPLESILRGAGKDAGGPAVSRVLAGVRAAAANEAARPLLEKGRLVKAPEASTDADFAGLLGGLAPTAEEAAELRKAGRKAAKTEPAAREEDAQAQIQAERERKEARVAELEAEHAAARDATEAAARRVADARGALHAAEAALAQARDEADRAGERLAAAKRDVTPRPR